MPRTKAMATVARELSKAHQPDQLRQLIELLTEEAEKPRVDKRQYGRLQREIQTAYIQLTNAEEELSGVLTNAGKTTEEINSEINDLRREAERKRVAGEPVGNGRRGRRKKDEGAGE